MSKFEQKKLAKLIALGLVVGGFNFANVDSVHAATADEAFQKATEAKALATTNENRIFLMKDQVDAVEEKMGQIEENVADAVTDAETAAGKAETAANEAKAAADSIGDLKDQVNANTQGVADAKKDAADAKAAANEVKDKVNQAVRDSTTANNKVDMLNVKVDTKNAKQDAAINEAKDTANDAKVTADAAKDAAKDAQKDANKAIYIGSTAENKANIALGQNQAQDKAIENAQGTADTALTIGANAALQGAETKAGLDKFKKDQAEVDKNQNDRLDLNDRVDKYQSQAIAGLQSDNLAQNKEIAANKEAIADNKEAIENVDAKVDQNKKDQAVTDKAQNDRLDLNDRVDAYQSQAIGKLQTENVEQNKYMGNEADKKKYDGKLNYTDIDASLSENVADLDHSLKAEENARVDADDELRQNIQNVDTKFSGEVSRLDSRIDKVDDKINKVGAMAAAIANLHTMGYDPEAPTEFAMSVGQYRDETGMAIGLFHYPNRDFMLSLSVSRAGEEYMGGIGATWKFGRKSPEKMLAEQKEKAAKEKLAKAEAMKEAARQARVEAQMARHAKMLAEREAAK